MQPGHMISLNQMQAGAVPGSNIQPNVGGFPTGMTNIQGPLGVASGGQNFPMGGLFNRPQTVQMPQVPGLNTYQPGMGPGGNIGLPPPPPPPHGSAPQ